MNSVNVIGRLTRDPELRETQQGTKVTSFSLAVENPYTKSNDGERGVDFFDVVAWRSTAEFVSKYFSKGIRVGVTGRLQAREWQDKDGNKRKTVEIVADNVFFADAKRENGGGGYNTAAPSGGYGGAGNASQKAVDISANDFTELDEDDGELPF